MDVLVSGRWLFTRGFLGVKPFGVELKSTKETSTFTNDSVSFTINATRTGPLLREESAINCP